jgi:hypothetical protein
MEAFFLGECISISDVIFFGGQLSVAEDGRKCMKGWRYHR